ncbi:2Fe-2S ferredoxin-like superfamily protein [Raphanus sativus]|uniref:Ferredoxin n=1 Tax=Raphanus sativus TaxID=3726 RepID=A0A6J0MF74_RAPSA|nr:ferredoxin C 1, chloroplastic [Raphanus sativus]KAJ4912295.1 2Fe-2S ferredoxin-like superfamily protein [Raphanus sativus]
MATLPLPQISTISLPKPYLSNTSSFPFRNVSLSTRNRRIFLTGGVVARSYKVVVEQDGKTTELEVEPDETILSKALESGMDVPYDCNLGVCMTCPAKLVTGTVDQSDGMLSEDVVERGYALLCASYPTSDCHIKMIPEEELLSLQLATAND